MAKKNARVEYMDESEIEASKRKLHDTQVEDGGDS